MVAFSIPALRNSEWSPVRPGSSPSSLMRAFGRVVCFIFFLNDVVPDSNGLFCFAKVQPLLFSLSIKI